MTIKPIDKSEIPDSRNKIGKSPARIFAEQTIREFVKTGIDAAEVTDMPQGLKTAQITSQLRYVIENQSLTHEVKVRTRKLRVFLEKQPPPPARVLKIPVSNPRRGR